MTAVAERGQVWDLVALAAGGDREAFGEIYGHYYPIVFAQVLRKVSGNRALAEDMTQETFFRALRSIGQVEFTGRDYGAWLGTIARNIVIDYYRSHRFRREIVTDTFRDATVIDLDPLIDPELVAFTDVRSVAVIDAIESLTPDQAACITARYLDDLSIAETAERLGKPETAVKSLTYRATRALSELLGGADL